MKKLITLALIAFAALVSEANVVTNIINDAGTTTNTVTNIVQEVRVRYDKYAITNGYTETYSGTLITNTIIDNVMQEWTTNGFVLVTNSHKKVVGGSITNKTYDIDWRLKPYYFSVPITNITVIVR